MTRRQTPYSTKKAGNKVLVVRFSALGDILMTVPVVIALAKQYPDLDITFVSRPHVRSIFEMMPANVHFKGIQLKTFFQRKTFLWIFLELKKLRPATVCDLHRVFRTVVLDFLFKITGTKVFSIEKGRKNRRKFLKTRPLVQQKTTFERYAEVFAEAGFPILLNPEIPLNLSRPDAVKDGIGIAPFAAHEGKMLPLDKVEFLVGKLSESHRVYLFGAGDKESALLNDWECKYGNVTNMAGKLENLAAELQFISGLKLMFCMDSANMHLASLAGTRAVSVWGATHPYAGFLGWGQSIDDCVQLQMECRPCSIYGQKACARGTFPCLKQVSPETIYDKIIESL